MGTRSTVDVFAINSAAVCARYSLKSENFTMNRVAHRRYYSSTQQGISFPINPSHPQCKLQQMQRHKNSTHSPSTNVKASRIVI